MSPYVLIFAGDRDEKNSDFFAVVDVRPGSPTLGKAVPTVPIGMTAMPVGRAQMVVALDISDPANPREVSRLKTPVDFNPHWAATDPGSDRIVIGAELGGEHGMYLLTFDSVLGRLSFDETIISKQGRVGYIDLEDQDWPHGDTGAAWGHAALFLPKN